MLSFALAVLGKINSADKISIDMHNNSVKFIVVFITSGLIKCCDFERNIVIDETVSSS